MTLPAEAARWVDGAVPIVGADWITNPQVSGVVPFAVVSGRMPALALQHHGTTADSSCLLRRAHHNVADGAICRLRGVRQPGGGGIDFWDRNKDKRIPRRVVLPPGDGGGAASHVTMKEEAHLGLTSPSPFVGYQ